jgi:hypothetical protein
MKFVIKNRIFLSIKNIRPKSHGSIKPIFPHNGKNETSMFQKNNRRFIKKIPYTNYIYFLQTDEKRKLIFFFFSVMLFISDRTT